ncbi:uncharacterized protein UV8b_00339 [Ustilaginoidea virens]|uniref:Ureidoglycolate hydrolase n=1 Tax=Ustilaginoidea virens TaxID=1159556 RepID=A0A8E5MDF8_USTVR|nr:uncharacterized protein UV8b_00339 [Ustilaginoidea virens]QUC16098.1 hypothetical protein UV8b_00339 [Ustilaginoidea virens]
MAFLLLLLLASSTTTTTTAAVPCRPHPPASSPVMPPPILPPIQLRHRSRIRPRPLTAEAFSPFGDVIHNPRPDVHPSALPPAGAAALLPPNAVAANQGSAIQYRHASRVRNLYAQAPGRAASPVVSLFVCAARAPRAACPLRVLERHPFTTQTFAPVRSSARAYLVVVAPSLPAGELDERFPAPPAGGGLPGRGLPDLPRLRAFVATDAQAVTYGAGTWHAPMVALGAAGTTLDFVVSQFASGEADEDCQVVEVEGVEVEGVEVAGDHGARQGVSKL